MLIVINSHYIKFIYNFVLILHNWYIHYVHTYTNYSYTYHYTLDMYQYTHLNKKHTGLVYISKMSYKYIHNTQYTADKNTYTGLLYNII